MDRPQWVTNESEWLRDCQEVVRVSRAILEGTIDVVEGIRALSQLRFALRADSDPDFLVITGVDSDTDSLPVGAPRIRWHPAALARVDQERQEVESHWKA